MDDQEKPVIKMVASPMTTTAMIYESNCVGSLENSFFVNWVISPVTAAHPANMVRISQPINSFIKIASWYRVVLIYTLNHRFLITRKPVQTLEIVEGFLLLYYVKRKKRFLDKIFNDTHIF